MRVIHQSAVALTNPLQPVAFGQEALFAAFQRNPGDRTHHVRLSCYVRGSMDARVAGAAFDCLVDCHPMLRTVYARIGAELWQRPVDRTSCDFRIVDLNREGAGNPDDLIRQESDSPFDLEHGPVFRVRLFSLGQGDCILVLCGHQIAVDYASLRILLRDFRLCYAALAESRTFQLPPQSTSYYAYVQQQRRSIDDERGSASLEFWRARLPRQETTADLPLDRVRPVESDRAPAELRSELPERLVERLSALALRWSKMPSTLYLAAYAILLSRYGAAERVPIGLLATGRNTEELENVVGNFSNLLLVTATCAPRLTYRKLVAQISMKTREALEHGDLPLALVVEKLALPAPVGRAPFCDFHFAWEDGECSGDIAGTTFEGVLECGPVAGPFDVGLKVHSIRARVQVSFAYRSDLFERGTIEGMSRHFLRLLESAANNPDTAIDDLELMADEEQARVLGPCAGAVGEFPRQCLHELFAEQVALRPEAEALVFDGARLSYRALDLRSNRIAGFLRSQGLRSGEPVGIFMKSSIDMIVSIVGVLKAGGSYAPIDPTYPAERIDFMVQDMAARWILTHRQVLANHAAPEKLVYVDDPDSPVALSSEEPVSNIASPDSIAALIYTSGSTGQPKGTLIPHRGVVRTIRNSNYLTVTAEDRVAQAMSPSFDVCIAEIWCALANGAALVGMPREILLAPSAMAVALRAERISVIFLSTAYLNQIGREAPDILKDVRAVMFGGEAAEPEPVRNILKHGPPQHLINCYGPTEAVVTATYHKVESVPDDARTIPIGQPVTNARVYLLDARMRPVPYGVPGEIYIGGEISSGYWNRPDLNRERFVDDFISGVKGARLYRTGDLARLRADGHFEFIGRIDQQVKIRGYRIELPEVQLMLASHPDVNQAFVMVREDQPGDRRLVAYVTLKRDLPFAGDILREYAATKLPNYMVPAVIVPMTAIPLTPNGKIDRAALVMPRDRPAKATALLEPGTALERAVARIWKDLLVVEHIGLKDNFFDLGGDSLLGMRLTVELRDTFAIDMPLRYLFNAGSLREFCAMLENNEQQPGRLERIARILDELEEMPADDIGNAA